MAEIVTLLQNVAQKVRKCPEPTLVQAYREAARQFCIESRWLRRTIELGALAGDSQVNVILDSAGDGDLDVIGIRSVRAFSPANDDSDWAVTPGDPTLWQVNPRAAQPGRYAYQPEATILLAAPCDAAYTFKIVAQVAPNGSTETLPDDLLAKWSRMLDCGALAYLYEIPGQSWSNDGKARKEAVKFQAAINNAKADEQRSYNTGTVMARIPRMF